MSFLRKVGTVLEMIKFEHSVFALPFALTGALLAVRDSGLSWSELGGKFGWIVIAMVAGRSAAMAFNRLIDAEIDARNPRTSMRAIPSGLVSKPFTWGFVAFWCVAFFVAAAQLNPLCLRLAPIALIVLFGYSYTKRVTALSHFVLGLALGIAPAAAWIAIRASLDPMILLLTAAVTFWTAGFDIIYSCQDFAFDSEEGLYSIPRVLGIRKALPRVARVNGAGADLAGARDGVGAAQLGGRRRRRRAADLRAQPGQALRSLARQRRLLHDQRHRQRAVLLVLGRGCSLAGGRTAGVIA